MPDIYDIAGAQRPMDIYGDFNRGRENRQRRDSNDQVVRRQRNVNTAFEKEAPLREAQRKGDLAREKYSQLTDPIEAFQKIAPTITSQEELEAYLPALEQINPKLTENLTGDYTKDRAKLAEITSNGDEISTAINGIYDAYDAADGATDPNEKARLGSIASIKEQQLQLTMQLKQAEAATAQEGVENKRADTANKIRQSQGEGTSEAIGVVNDLLRSGAITQEQADNYKKDRAANLGAITGTTPDDPRNSSTISKAHQTNLDMYNMSDNLDELLTDAMPKMMEFPDAIGAKGKAAGAIGGFLYNMGYEEMGEAVSQMISNGDQKQIAGMQAQLSVIRAQLTPMLTLEGGKRISDKELEISNKTAGVIDEIKGPADLAKAYPQVIGGLRQLYEESLVSRYQLAKQDKDIDYMYDLTTKAGVVKMINHLEQAGIDEKSRARAITRLQRIQRSGG